MKITIQSTAAITSLNGVQVRLWTGVTSRGIPCKVFVHRVAVQQAEDNSDFERELQEMLPPPHAVPPHLIL